MGGVGVGVGVGAMGSANEIRRYLQRILPLAEPIHTQVFPAVPTCDFVEGYLYASIYLYWYLIHNISFSVGGIQSFDSV